MAITEENQSAMKFLQSALIINGLDSSVLSRGYVEMMRSVGVDCCHLSLDGTGLSGFSEIHEFVHEHSDKVLLVKCIQDILESAREGKLGIIAGWQSSNDLSNGRHGENDWWSVKPQTQLRAYRELGLRICGIAYQIANVFGGGAIDGHIGLSKAGRRLVEEIHRLNIVLDVGGHTGDKASMDALEISDGVPVICSHGNARAIANSSRNLSDEMIMSIAKTGGVIGINAINDFVMRGEEMAQVHETPLGTTHDMIRHLEYMKDLVGIDHIGLGPDFTWGMSDVRDRAIFGTDSQDAGPRRFVKGFENISQLGNVVTALRDRGWDDGELNAVFSQNWLRVYEAVW